MGTDLLILGRDDAGSGDCYGPFDSQNIFTERVPEGALKIQFFGADNTAYSKKLDRVVMMREAPDHTPEDFVVLSGTKVRQMLGQGMAPPPEFSRPEVAKEIGRASCRERVGQYVSFSVVDGSLTKKTSVSIRHVRRSPLTKT